MKQTKAPKQTPSHTTHLQCAAGWGFCIFAPSHLLLGQKGSLLSLCQNHRHSLLLSVPPL